MLKYGYHPKQIADVCGNSPEMIFKHYAKWIGGEEEKFGSRALPATPRKKPLKRLVRGGGFEPPRHFWH